MYRGAVRKSHSLQREYSASLRPVINGLEVKAPPSPPFPYLRRLRDKDLIEKALHGSAGECQAATALCAERGISISN